MKEVMLRFIQLIDDHSDEAVFVFIVIAGIVMVALVAVSK